MSYLIEERYITINDFIVALKQVWASLYFYMLLAVILIDVILGISKAVHLKSFDSTISWRGFTKHITTILLVMFIGTFARLIGYNEAIYFSMFSCTGFIITYISSIIENYDVIYGNVPDFIIKYFNRKRENYLNELNEIAERNIIGDEKNDSKKKEN